MAGSLTDIFAAMQNGVVALGNFKKQLTGSFNNINARLAAISTAPTVTSFNARSSAVVPVQGDYPTSLIPGTTTNDNATAGNIGEYTNTTVFSTASTVLASGVTTNFITLTIPSGGDWELRGGFGVLPSSGMTAALAGISSVSLGFIVEASMISQLSSSSFAIAGRQSWALPSRRISVANSTTYYLVSQITVSASATAYGYMDARRPR